MANSSSCIYLDHNAATPIRTEVVEAMARCYAEIYANPASQHRPGQRARRVLEDSRERIAGILDVELTPPRGDRLIFTSGGTEANNLAILGIARALALPNPDVSPPGQIIISSGEHATVIEPAEHLLELGWRLDALGMTADGIVRVDSLQAFLDQSPCRAISRLVSVQTANHETGVLQPIAEIAALCNQHEVFLHTDAVQAVGKLPVGFRSLGVAAMSLSAHKFGGPLGIGALAVRSDVPMVPLFYGGHQQSGLRPGTESAALALGMATALELAQKEQEAHCRRLGKLRDRFERSLQAAWPNIVVHGLAAPRLPQTSSIAFLGMDAQTLLMALDLAGVACSIGSACSSGTAELSPTLRAMGLPNEVVSSSLRFSLGATTTEEEIDEAVGRIAHVCAHLSSR